MLLFFSLLNRFFKRNTERKRERERGRERERERQFFSPKVIDISYLFVFENILLEIVKYSYVFIREYVSNVGIVNSYRNTIFANFLPTFHLTIGCILWFFEKYCHEIVQLVCDICFHNKK